jgi:SAM-dependent methyltransferase
MRQSVVSFLKSALPQRAVREIQYWQHRLRRGKVAKNGAAAAFTEVYTSKAWGDDGTDFYSGPGTIEAGVTLPYLDFLRAEFAAMGKPPRVLDLGCGDFKVCVQLLPSVASFTGVDVVPSLVERNNRLYGSETVKFLCADISQDPLPEADVVLVREVMQHMSNAQVGRLLKRLSAYKVAYVTNVEPPKDSVTVMNRDLVPGPDTRGVFGSGLFLDEPPFSFQAEVVLNKPIEQGDGTVATMTTRKAVHG